MKTSRVRLDNLLGVTSRSRRKNKVDQLEKRFEKPIIHKQIHGDKVYVPLNIERVWNEV
jgi:hypothetical protein